MRNRITLTLTVSLALAGWCSVGFAPGRGAGLPIASPDRS
jgi:hypothetical protein